MADLYRLVVEGEAREIYVVEAHDAEDARRIFDNGEVGQPEVSEVCGAEVVRVEAVDMGGDHHA